MPQHLAPLPYSRFLTSEALAYIGQTLPIYRNVAGVNSLLVGILDKIEEYQKGIYEIVKRDNASVYTPEARKWDLARIDMISAVNSFLESKMRRSLKMPKQAQAAEKLSRVVSRKCSDFHQVNEVEQTAHIDTLRIELEKPENKQYAELTGADELFNDLFSYNENFKQAVQVHVEENDLESPKVRVLRNKMMQSVSLFHDNIELLMELDPSDYNVYVQRINAFSGEIMARIRSRINHEQNKGTTEAVIVESRKVST